MLDYDALLAVIIEDMEPYDLPARYLVARIPSPGGFREVSGEAARRYLYSGECDERCIGFNISKLRNDSLAMYNEIARAVAARCSAEGWKA